VFRFYAVPSWQLIPASKKADAPAPEEPLRPAIGETPVEEILGRAEYRGEFALERGKRVLEEARGPAVYAQPPNDLPALLRTADQLLLLARQEGGERVHTWRCECGTRYSMAASFLRPVSLRCERCGRIVDLDLQRTDGESTLADPARAQVNAARQTLADFFREAMARGWPVLVEKP
jgi:hypothetical protein